MKVVIALMFTGSSMWALPAAACAIVTEPCYSGPNGGSYTTGKSLDDGYSVRRSGSRYAPDTLDGRYEQNYSGSGYRMRSADPFADVPANRRLKNSIYE
ncbi:hypothetical protein [Rhizobium sp. SGZ-381]|uniref:hypothetical protein n=1 Tax=Rhizobium sp. SGZ-381 TaxID=3342800 RepID=UPI00366FE416